MNTSRNLKDNRIELGLKILEASFESTTQILKKAKVMVARTTSKAWEDLLIMQITNKILEIEDRSSLWLIIDSTQLQTQRANEQVRNKCSVVSKFSP